MSLIKIALTVLGTVGLTAGTVLAVAEPTPSSLPEAAANASACSGCPAQACGTAKCTSAASACAKTASACSKDRPQASAAEPLTVDFGPAVQQVTAFLDDATDSAAWSGITDLTKCEVVQLSEQSSSCGSGKCGSAGLACAKTASACAKSCASESPCQVNSANTIGGPINPEDVQQIAACSEVNAACTATGCSSDISACSSAACETETACPTGKAKKKLTLSLGFGSNGPIIRVTSGDQPAPYPEAPCDGLAACLKTAVAACACPAGTCEKENCDACPCEGKCEQTHQVAATACEAKPACAAACPTSACNATACTAETCKATSCSSCPESCESSETVAGDADFSNSACSVAACDCKDCCCESCDCTTDTACPPGEICPVAVRLHRFQTAGILPNGIRLMATGIAPPTDEAACQGEACRNYDSYRLADAAELPGRVRLTHVPDIQFFPPGPEFLAANRMIAFSGFDAPVAAPRPTSAAPRPSIAGAWGRSIGSSALSFVIDGDRIRGMCDESVLFSGTCSVSQDGQVFGVLDEVQYSDEPNAALLTQSLVDQPFAFRFTRDCDDLIIKDFRCGGMSNEVEVDGVKTSLAAHVAAFVCGRYERGPTE